MSSRTPTAGGVDVGSKAEIYKLFELALKERAPILIVPTMSPTTSFFSPPPATDPLPALRGTGVAVAGAALLSEGSACSPSSPMRGKRRGRSSATLSTGQTTVAVSLLVYGLPLLTLLSIRFFSLLSAEGSPHCPNAHLADKSIVALLALAATLPMMAGRIDLTVGFGIVLWHILAISFQVRYGIPWPFAVLLVVACAGFVGLVNGVLVEVAQVDAFVATLGTGTILYALALWHTDGRQIIGTLPRDFLAINSASLLGIPVPAFYVLGLALLLWIISERLPIGRFIYAIGANEKAAALNGIPVRIYVIGVFIASGVITGLAGCVLGAKLRIGQANVGLDFLLPALVGAFLGSTTIKPGRVNVWGSVFGILILAVGISGIQLLGGAFFVEPLFNGTTLVVAIALAAFAQRRRTVIKLPPREPQPAPAQSESAKAAGAT